MAVLRIESPKVPFRIISKEEKDKIRDYFRENPKEKYNDKIWMQTIPEARKVIEIIRTGGFFIGGELAHGNGMDGYGVHSHVYSRNYPNQKDIQENCDYKNVIGSVGLWESWGFFSNPVAVWYQNKDLVIDSIELHNYLDKEGISFRDNVNRGDITDQILSLEQEKRNCQELLDKLSGIELRG